MNTITGLIRGYHTPEETAILEKAAGSFQEQVIEKIKNDGATIEFRSEDDLPKDWPLGASAVNYLENGTGKNTIIFLRNKFNKGRAIHELFHAYDWKKVAVNGKLVWKSDSEQDPHVQELHSGYKRNFEHDFLKNVMDTLKAQHVLPGAWYPIALRVQEAMHYPFLAAEARQLFRNDAKAKNSPLVYFLTRYQSSRVEVHGIDPADGEMLQRAYQDYHEHTFEIPVWKKVAIESTSQARSYPVDEQQADRRFSEYAYLNDVREYTAEGAKFLLDTPQTRKTLEQSDPGLLNYLVSQNIARN